MTLTYERVKASSLLFDHSSRHRWTGRYEAHLWDNSCRREGQTRKGRQGNKNQTPKPTKYDMLFNHFY